jgi:hypothetical protein
MGKNAIFKTLSERVNNHKQQLTCMGSLAGPAEKLITLFAIFS